MSANKKKHYPPYDRVFEDYYNCTNNSMKDRMDYIRSKIEHEDNLISNRINWLLAIQGILITSYVANYKDLDGILQTVVLVFGFVSALNISTNICTGERSLRRIRAMFQDENPKYDFVVPCIIYGWKKKKEYKIRELEKEVLEKRLLKGGNEDNKPNFFELNNYDKRLLLGDYDGGSCFIQKTSKTTILPVICLLAWMFLSGVTIYTDLHPTANGSAKIEVKINNNSYTCDKCR